jgi:hypothetical protein
MLFAAAAYAEHAPSNYNEWNIANGTNSVVQSPHSGYAATTVKCNVCHSIHRSPVTGMKLANQDVSPSTMYQYNTGNTEMLLRSTVADACNYCHINSAVGGVRLYNGNSANRSPALWDSGYGHTVGNACTYCHATHGASTFKGAVAGKVIKYTATQHTRNELFTGGGAVYGVNVWGINPNVTGNMDNHSWVDPSTCVTAVIGVQDEIYTQNSALLVDARNLAQFTDLNSLMMGITANQINSAVGANTKDLQVGAFCTTCHSNMYSSGSENVQNIDQDSGLWGGLYGGWTTVAGFSESGTWKVKGHPVSDVTNDFAAAGSTLGTGKTVAWSDADTCRKCHDAGTSDSLAGVVYSSWPHITPGYYRFMGAGSSAAAYAASGSKTQDMVDDATGWLSAGQYVNPTSVLPTPNQAGNYMLYPGQNYKSDDPLLPEKTDHIGTDGLCLKCHVQQDSCGLGVGKSF